MFTQKIKENATHKKNREREVTAVCKYKSKNITHVVNEDSKWKKRSIAGVVYDMNARIEGDRISYFTQKNGSRSYIEVVDGENDVYLRAESDSTKKNNLDELEELSEDQFDKL